MHGVVELKNYQQIFLTRRINKQDSTRILFLSGRLYHEKYRDVRNAVFLFHWAVVI